MSWNFYTFFLVKKKYVDGSNFVRLDVSRLKLEFCLFNCRLRYGRQLFELSC